MSLFKKKKEYDFAPEIPELKQQVIDDANNLITRMKMVKMPDDVKARFIKETYKRLINSLSEEDYNKAVRNDPLLAEARLLVSKIEREKQLTFDEDSKVVMINSIHSSLVSKSSNRIQSIGIMDDLKQITDMAFRTYLAEAFIKYGITVIDDKDLLDKVLEETADLTKNKEFSYHRRSTLIVSLYSYYRGACDESPDTNP